MSQDSLVLVLTIFVGLVALSQLAQLAAIVVIARQVKALQEKIDTILPKAQSLIDAAQKTVDQGRKQILDITAKSNEILELVKVQMGRVDTVVADATTRSKAQLERLDIVMEDAIGRFHETVVALHIAVRRPLREINGVSAGVKAAVAHMVRGGRPNVSQATHDEEMFI